MNLCDLENIWACALNYVTPTAKNLDYTVDEMPNGPGRNGWESVMFTVFQGDHGKEWQGESLLYNSSRWVEVGAVNFKSTK